MSEETSKNSITVVQSKTGLPVPSVSNTFLHSSYDPISEAQRVAKANITTIENNKNILILGFGFGYHVFEIQKLLKQAHKNKTNIVVIEPNKELYKNYKKIFGSNLKGVTVFCCDDVNLLYSNLNFAKFLSTRPGVIPHAPSFNLQKDFFKKLLSFTSPTALKSVMRTIHSSKLTNYLSDFHENYTINDVVNSKKEKGLDTKLDYLLMGLDSLVKTEVPK